jgi:hypothetical protein
MEGRDHPWNDEDGGVVVAVNSVCCSRQSIFSCAPVGAIRDHGLPLFIGVLMIAVVSTAA